VKCSIVAIKVGALFGDAEISVIKICFERLYRVRQKTSNFAFRTKKTKIKEKTIFLHFLACFDFCCDFIACWICLKLIKLNCVRHLFI
jgi:hypothetical protein